MSDGQDLKDLREAFPGIWVREDGAFRYEPFGMFWEPGDVESDLPRDPAVMYEVGSKDADGRLSIRGGDYGHATTRLKLSQLWALTNYIDAHAPVRAIQPPAPTTVSDSGEGEPILQDKDKDEEAGTLTPKGREDRRVDGPREYSKAFEEGFDARMRRASSDASHMRDDLKDDWLDGWHDADRILTDAARDEAAEMIAAVERGESEIQQPATPIPEGGSNADNQELEAFLRRDGAVKHNGGPRPVPVGWRLEILTRGCGEWPIRNIEEIGESWWWEGEESHPTNIIAYRVVEPATDKPLIVDDTPTIPRSEIPQGAAVETFTDAGVETVKLSGITHIVDDEPERVAETQPDAAYAPIHNVDEPVTNPVADDFAKGILHEIDAKDEKRSWLGLFGAGKKETADAL